jgi:hypothetical protein
MEKRESVKDSAYVSYNWASELTAEGGSEEAYHQTEAFKDLAFDIEKTKRGLAKVSGLQGTGKTRLLKELENRYEGAITIRWARGWMEAALEWDSVYKEYFKMLQQRAAEIITDHDKKSAEGHKHKLGAYYSRPQDVETDALEKVVGKAECARMRREILMGVLNSTPLLLIDMPDYNKSNIGLMNADIDELYSLWQSLAQEDIHFVIAVQEELVMKHPHFFWGKCRPVKLKPLSPNELAEAYKAATGEGNKALTDEALLELGRLSRGVFRRFKKYMGVAIKKNLEEQAPLTVEHIKNTITADILDEDMELELADVFRDPNQKKLALAALDALRSGPMNQKEIAESLGVSEATAGKIVSKLQLYDYVGRERAEHGAWTVTRRFQLRLSRDTKFSLIYP